jgi:glutamate decarboxylase
MVPASLQKAIARAKDEGKTPLYVNATAGTTVLGSFDPLEEIAAICRAAGVWMHVDASWGGPAVFSAAQRWKLAGSHLANSLTVNPHKMMGVPVTCSFLLTPDLAVFHRANTLAAGYLFHSGVPDPETDIWDLADLTLQCGRRGDALKLFLAWVYYGHAGFERQIDHAFEAAAYLAHLLAEREDFILVSPDPLPCLQVCFYHAPGGRLADSADANTQRTAAMAAKLIQRGFMVDYAPGDRGSFFRVVVNYQTLKGTLDGLVKALEVVGREIGATAA